MIMEFLTWNQEKERLIEGFSEALHDAWSEVDKARIEARATVCQPRDHEAIRRLAAAQAGQEVVQALLNTDHYGAAPSHTFTFHNEDEFNAWLDDPETQKTLRHQHRTAVEGKLEDRERELDEARAADPTIWYKDPQ